MRPLLLVFVVATMVVGCQQSESKTPPPPASTASQPRTKAQQRTIDSTIGESMLPGAGVAKRALAVSDSAARRQAVMDSIANSR
jgi:hypothetical protein